MGPILILTLHVSQTLLQRFQGPGKQKMGLHSFFLSLARSMPVSGSIPNRNLPTHPPMSIKCFFELNVLLIKTQCISIQEYVYLRIAQK